MVTSAILELAIGVVFVWLLFSLALSTVNDALALVFRIRAKHLWLAVGRVLEPSTTRQARRFWDTIIRLPFSRDEYDVRPRSSASAADNPVRPTEAPPETGALQQRLQDLYDRLAPNLTDVALRGRRSKLTSLPTNLLAEAVARLATSVFPGDLVAQSNLPRSGQAVWNLEQRAQLETAVGQLAPDQNVTLDAVRNFTIEGKTPEQLEELWSRAGERLTARDLVHYFQDQPALADSLRSVLRISSVEEQAKAAIATVQARIDREMEQLSALYRRQSRKVLGLLGLPFVLATNTNAVGLVQQLHRDANLRQVVSASAASVSETDLNAVTAKYCTPPTTTSPPASPAINADPQSKPKPPTVEDVRDELRCAVRILGAADQLELVPNWASRWNASASTERGCCRLWRFVQSTVRSTVVDFGWVGRPITLIALSFGAQFWFDILRRLLGLRNRSGAAG